MSFYERWIAKRGRGGRITPQQMVAAKSVVNLVVLEAFKGISLGQLNVASEYYYGAPEPEDYNDMFTLLCEGIEEMKKNGGPGVA